MATNTPTSLPSSIFFFLFFFFATAGASDVIDAPLLTSKLSSKKTIIVSPSGKDDFTSVQAAIDAIVPDADEVSGDWTTVHVRSGVYREKVVIPKSKRNIFLRGNGKGRTSIVWDSCSSSNTDSATFTVLADNFVAFGISFKNEASMMGAAAGANQSVAAMVAGDKAAFYHCGFQSQHNTVFDNKGRHYYESCYVQGSIDFIFGGARSVFQSFEMFVLENHRMSDVRGSITAHRRRSGDGESGFVFLGGRVYGTGEVFLGRPRSARSQVVFSKTYLSKTVAPQGWTSWSYGSDTRDIVFGEHDCHGPGAATEKRASWSKQLGGEEAARFLTVDYIDGKDWLPAYH